MAEIVEFWKWFLENENRFRNAKHPIPEAMLDDILEHLHKVDEELYFEIGHDTKCDSGVAELVVTPEGQKAKCALTKDLISQAPKMAGWVFTAFRQPNGFDFTTSYEGVKVDPKEMWFLPLSSPQDENALGMRIGIIGYDEVEEERYLSACYIALDTSIGEEKVMEEIDHVEVCLLPADPEGEGFIEFTEIGKYLEWKHTRH